MKESNDFNEKIDRYYTKETEKNNLKEEDLKEYLDKMNIINDLNENVPMKFDISSIVEKGQSIRFEKNLKKDTLKFIVLAVFIALIAGLIAIKTSFIWVFILQFIALIVLFIINILSLKKDVRRES